MPSSEDDFKFAPKQIFDKQDDSDNYESIIIMMVMAKLTSTAERNKKIGITMRRSVAELFLFLLLFCSWREWIAIVLLYCFPATLKTHWCSLVLALWTYSSSMRHWFGHQLFVDLFIELSSFIRRWLPMNQSRFWSIPCFLECFCFDCNFCIRRNRISFSFRCVCVCGCWYFLALDMVDTAMLRQRFWFLGNRVCWLYSLLST